MTDALPTLAILAGGEGSRMGKSKGELCVGDQPILSYLLDRFRWEGPTLLVTAPGRAHPPGAERFDREVVDPVSGQGPLRGILTALEAIATEQVIVATIDMPGIEKAQLEWLVAGLRSHREAVGLMMARTEGIEPFPSIFRRSAIGMVRAQLDADQFSVQRLSAQAGFIVSQAPPDWDDIVWTNLNHPADIEAFTRRSSRADR